MTFGFSQSQSWLIVAMLAAFLTNPIGVHAQSDLPPVAAPPTLEQATNVIPQPPADQPANKPKIPAVRKPVFKPANAQQNQNVVFQNQMRFINQGGLANVGEERMNNALSPQRLAQVTPPPELLKLVRELDDPAFQVRENASSKLLDQAFSDESIWCVLDRFPLSEEAHSRLLTAALRRVSERPRGALGIRMGQPPDGQDGVVIQATLPNMPAEIFLKAGDIIQEIEGSKVRSTEDLVESIRNYLPGHEIQIKLSRPEKDAQGRTLIGPDGAMIVRPLDLVMPLGNANDLDKAEPGEMAKPQNMQLRQRANEGRIILRRFAENATLRKVAAPAPTP